MNKTTKTWRILLGMLVNDPPYVSYPRGLEVKEMLNGSYIVPMPACVDLKDRDVNYPFMFAEAAWILSGSNMLSDITPFMKNYGKFSDEGLFMRGAYGPKVIDQIPYVVSTLVNDRDSRQAVINIWRERPGPSKDIPCTVSLQFLIRKNKLHLVATMRSQDIVLGYTYDVFTFSMIAYAVGLALQEVSEEFDNVELGDLCVNAGSLHLYSDFYKKAEYWSKSVEIDERAKLVDELANVKTYEKLVDKLWSLAEREKSK